MTRYFVAGEELAKWSFLTELNHTTDPKDAFDIACLLPGTDFNLVSQQLFNARRLLTPIINLTGISWDRADYHTSDPSLAEITKASEELAPLLQAVDQLNIRESADYPSLVILGIAHTRGKMISTLRTANIACLVDYPLISGITEQRRLLEELAHYGLLERQYFDRLHFCGQCGSSRLHVREECISCRSSNLQAVSLVHHYRCGYQAVETAFRHSQNLECPKCHKQLRHYGVDYDKPSSVHSCGSCGEISDEPAIGFVCNDCSKHEDGANISVREWHHYHLTPSGAAALQAGFLPQNSLQSMLSQTVGICPTTEFASSAAYLSKIAERFSRPLSALILQINNFDELRNNFGVSNLASAFMLLGEVVSQIVRSTDLVAAKGQCIYLLLPETSFDNLDIVTQRLQEETTRHISLPLDLSIKRYQTETITELLRDIL